MRERPPADHRAEPGYRQWHAPVYGPCAVCGLRGRLVRHHVITEQLVRREGGAPWELANCILLGYGDRCGCHRLHHRALAKLPLSLVPAAAIAFAVELLGAGPAEAYLHRYYAAG